MIRNVTVYCSSSNSAPEPYFECASRLGKGLAERGMGLVFGGGHVGLMGRTADTVMQYGGKVTGIIPRFLEEREVAHYGISELVVVKTMHERKMKLTEWGDAFVILPGGFGTLDELMEIITWKHLGHHCKPILLLNCEGFWNPLLTFFGRIADDRMVKADYSDYYTVCETADAVFEIFDIINADREPGG